MDKLQETLARFKATVSLAGSASGNMKQTLAEASPDGAMTWLIYSVLAGIGGILVGHLAARSVANWLISLPPPESFPEAPDRIQRISFLLFRLLVNIFTILIIAAVAALIIALFLSGHRPSVLIGVVILSAYTAFLLARALFLNFLVPYRAAYRPILMDDPSANGLYRLLLVITAIAVAVLAISIWMDMAGLDRNTHKLILMTTSALSALLFSYAVIAYRKPVAKAILGSPDQLIKSFWIRMLAKSWHVLAMIYFLGSSAISASRLLLDKPNAFGLMLAPLAALTSGFILYGLGLLIIDRLAGRKVVTIDTTKFDEPEKSDGLPEGEKSATDSGEVATDVGKPSFKSVFERGLALLVWAFGIGLIVRIWGGRLIEGTGWFSEAVYILFVTLAAYLIYQAVEVWVAREAGEEVDPTTAAISGAAEPGGASTSRLSTLLPIFKNFLMITIAVIAVMLILVDLGVDITPLFAGAGVVGIAVGFGAQTLVRDIFSGAFFLIDDAFRKGEYIDIGSVKGTVEKISIRSMQLRHHNGPLNTIPFGEIKQLTNYSRDWVMMKLPLRLTYDTDIEKVRKLVKKLGQELLEHPELGKKFLQPLKSQGVIEMDDSAMIVRVKFMTKPGDQWDIRKIVYQRIRELFEENGIKFAHREVTVRIAEEDGHGPLDDEARKKAALGAARAVLDEPIPEK